MLGIPSHRRRYYCLFSCLFNNVSAILALQSVIKGLLAASFVVMQVLMTLLQVFSDAGTPGVLCLYLRWQCQLIWGAGWLLFSNWLQNTNALPYVVKYSVQKLVPCVSAEMSLCTVSNTKKTSQSPHEALLYRAGANQVCVESLYFNTDELFQPLVFLQADASYLETEELAYSCVPLLPCASNSSAMVAQPAVPWLVTSKDRNIFFCLCI